MIVNYKKHRFDVTIADKNIIILLGNVRFVKDFQGDIMQELEKLCDQILDGSVNEYRISILEDTKC